MKDCPARHRLRSRVSQVHGGREMAFQSCRNSINKDRRFFCALLLSVPFLFASACGGGGSNGGGTPPSNPTITSVNVSCSPTSVQTGQTSQCTATVSGTGSYSSLVTWSSTDGTITSAGVFSPSAVGNATITATSAEDSTKSGGATVTVTAPSSITAVSVVCSPTSILTTQTSTCTPTVTGTGSFSTSVTWSVSPTSMGAVGGAGIFTPAEAGTATITATSTQDSTKSGSTTVTVTVPSTIAAVSVVCSPTSILTTQTSTCTPTVTGTGSFSTSVTWSVSPTSMGAISSSGVFTPSGAGTATITATSTQDLSKSGQTIVAVTAQTNLTVTPTSSQLLVFHSQQFTASISGGPTEAVTWAVNGIVGGNLTVGQIDSNGLYLAPNSPPAPATVAISATSETDSTKSASSSVTVLPDANAPAIVAVSPTAGQGGVALDSTVSIQFSDALDASTVTSSSITLSAGTVPINSALSYDPTSNIVSLTPNGVLAPGTLYSVTVNTLIADPAGTPLAAESQWSFTSQSTSSTNGVLSESKVTDPTTLTVVSYGGQKSTPDSQGNFTAAVLPTGSNLVAAMVPGKSFGWLAFTADQSQGTNALAAARVRLQLSRRVPLAGVRNVFVTRYQITASPFAAASSDKVTIDSQTTAESLLFMSPYLYHSDPTKAAVIKAAIAGDPNTALLAQALENASGDADPLSDSTVQTALQTAVISVSNTLSTSANGQPSVTASESTESADAAATLVALATPNCSNWSSNVVPAGQLQCLDLNYMALFPAGTAQNGSYTVTLSNQFCPGNIGKLPFFYTGCDVDSLAIAGPINPSLLPPTGPSSIVPGQGSNGPSSPAGDMLSCGLSGGSSLLNPDCSLLFFQGTSSFSALDPHVGFEAIVKYDFQQLGINLPDNTPVVPQFTMPASSGTTYVVRDYSGGTADSDELSNLFNNGYYGSYSSSLWVAALSINLSHSLTSIPEVFTTGDPSTINQCAWDNIGSSGELGTLTTQMLGQNFSTASEAMSSATSDANVLKGYYINAAEQCASDTVIDSVWDMAMEVTPFSEYLNAALEKIGGAGESYQRLYELSHTASPMETGIVAVSSPFASTPEVQALNPAVVSATNGNQPVQIRGTGFISGAQVHWQLADGTDEGWSITTSFNPTALNVEKNFGSQTASWQVQVVNPGGKSSTWFPFSVTAASQLPDLIVSTGSLSASSAQAGNQITVNYTVKNSGPGSAAASTTRIRLAVNQTATLSDPLLVAFTTPALAVGATSSGSQTVTIPSGTTAGNYYIVVTANADGALTESNGSNNQYPMALSVTAASQLPDLIVSTGSLSASSAQAGNQITVNYTVKNSGPGSAAASTTRIRLAVNQTATLSDPLLVAFTTPALAVGATSSGSQTVTIPSGTTAGNYYIVVTANADGALTESNGSNNQYPMALSVTAASSSFQIGTRVMAQSGGANVRDEQLDSPPRFSQLGGVHGTIAANAKYGTATGCSGTECTGNWWEIQWDSEPPNQNSLMGWSSESVIALAPTAGDVPQPNWASSNYTNGNPFYPSFAPNAPSNQLDGALGNCTWYAYGRLLDLGASKTQLGYFTGNANTWATTAPSTWVDNTPAVNSIAELDANSGFPLGHVAVVESLNSDGTITVTESSSGLIPTGNWMFLWRHRTVSPNWFSHFIHVPLTSGTGGTPSVSGVQPVPVPGLNGTQTLTINGQNFVSGATATYHDPVNNTTYPNNPTTFVSASQIKDTAFNDGGDAGTWTVTVTNPGGSPSTAANFTVN